MTIDDTVEQTAMGDMRPVVKKQRALTLVWFIPLIAALVGAWLVYKEMSQQGHIISIMFKDADGLEVGKTKIKYRNVTVGEVTDIRFVEGWKDVKVTAQMVQDAKPFLTSQSRFWVVRPQISGTNITGLSTLMSGAYIALDPVSSGDKQASFVGLEKQPLVTTDDPGTRYTLRATGLNSLSMGSPIYYRDFEVGRVENYLLDTEHDAVQIQIFIAAPYDKLVKTTSRFWNTSGLDFKMDATGLRVDTASMLSLVAGGISFETIDPEDEPALAKGGTDFELFGTYDKAMLSKFTKKHRYVLQFTESIKGLSIGAPVEINGSRIGEVVDIGLQYDVQKGKIQSPVIIEIEQDHVEPVYPEGLVSVVDAPDAVDYDDAIHMLVSKGLRAQIRSGNLLTGQNYIDLDFYPQSAKATIVEKDGDEIFPTMPSKSVAVMARLENIANTLEKDVMPKAGAAMDALNKTFDSANKTMESANAMLEDNAQLHTEVQRTLMDFGSAAASIDRLAGFLERHPEALITGKKLDEEKK